MSPYRVSNPGPLTYESGALPIALRSPAHNIVDNCTDVKKFLKVGWLVVFGLNGPLRQYFSLYRAVSPRERKEK